MRRVIIDGTKVFHTCEIHELLARELSFPEYYGANLDALFDCLTDPMEDTEIVIQNAEALKDSLVSHYGRLMKVLTRAAEESGHLTVTVLPEEEKQEPEAQ